MKNNDDRLKEKKLLSLIEDLFGIPDDLPEDELDDLYQKISPERNPKEWIRSIAQGSARSYRLKGQDVPHHVQAVLDATSERSIQDVKPSEMKNIIDSLLNSNPRPNFRPSIAFRKQPGGKLSEKDRKLLDGLVGEIDKKGNEEP